MNIADKSRLYEEIYRVLRPGGKLAMHDAMAGPGGPLIFPVPWASDPSTKVRTYARICLRLLLLTFLFDSFRGCRNKLAAHFCAG